MPEIVSYGVDGKPIPPDSTQAQIRVFLAIVCAAWIYAAAWLIVRLRAA